MHLHMCNCIYTNTSIEGVKNDPLYNKKGAVFKPLVSD